MNKISIAIFSYGKSVEALIMDDNVTTAYTADAHDAEEIEHMVVKATECARKLICQSTLNEIYGVKEGEGHDR